jgi:hypothetical protein
MNKLSSCPYSIAGRPRDSPAEAREALAATLSQASVSTPLFAHTLDQVARDPDIAIVLETSAELRFLLMRAEDAARAAFDAGDNRFGIGDWVVFFLEIETRLGRVAQSPVAASAVNVDPLWVRKLMAALFACQEPVFLRGWLLQALMVVRLLGESTTPLLDDLETIGNPINAEIVAAFANLGRWFGFRPELYGS